MLTLVDILIMALVTLLIWGAWMLREFYLCKLVSRLELQLALELNDPYLIVMREERSELLLAEAALFLVYKEIPFTTMQYAAWLKLCIQYRTMDLRSVLG